MIPMSSPRLSPQQQAVLRAVKSHKTRKEAARSIGRSIHALNMVIVRIRKKGIDPD